MNSCSDDSGLPPTNSSISSGDSSRIYLNCKFDFELAAESDDSLDNCSEGGMSAENFNTLKKGPLAPIDPPPEFQDSPQTTLLRTRGFQEFTTCLLDDIVGGALLTVASRKKTTAFKLNLRQSGLSNSDSRLNSKIESTIFLENIYDDPISGGDSTRNSDDHEVDYYISKQLSSSIKSKKSTNSQHLMRPNSRNSLQSRLSSSHNSLATGAMNKVDDSIFITQAMSHDALLGREIIDFYNVPLDSDIYALPVDMVLPTALGPGSARDHGRLQPQMAINSRRVKYPVPKRKKFFRKQQTNLLPKKPSISTSQSHLVQSTAKVMYESKRFSAPVDGSVATVSAAIETQCNGSDAKVKQKAATKKGAKATDSSGDDDQPTPPPPREQQPKVKTKRNKKERGDAGGKEITRKGLKQISKTLKNTSTVIIKPAKAMPTFTSFTGCGGQSQPVPTHINGTPKQTGLTTTTTTTPPTKRSGSGHTQFSINLKQKFCSIFRFRNNNKQSLVDEYENNHNNYEATAAVVVGAAGGESSTAKGRALTTAGNRKDLNRMIKLRALPPLPPPNSSALASDPATNWSQLPNNGPAATSTVLPPPLYRLLAASSTDSNNNIDCDTNNNDEEVGGNANEENDYNEEIESDDEEEEEARRRRPCGGRVGAADCFASNIERIKQYGWYWGPISSQAAEKILSNEPDGSFIVRDSSDDHYIFSLTFKLNKCVRHVRIDQDKGKFSFGSFARFKSRTIVDFIEKAVEHSRSGRYLFFLHRRPEHGPMRVQLSNPVSRFKHIQSLQHMCRFVILKTVVRKDLIQTLPLPRRILDYLSYKNCYSEQVVDDIVGLQCK